jgi:hypothetical protein
MTAAELAESIVAELAEASGGRGSDYAAALDRVRRLVIAGHR